MVVNISRSKYGNRKVVLNGYLFDSQAEARRYQELCLLARAGKISELRVHPKFKLVVKGYKVGTYVADFSYSDLNSDKVVEDVKSEPTRTSLYRLKTKLVKALYGIEVQEV